MEQYSGEEIADEHDCTKFYRNMSRTVDTANPDLIANMGTYYDEVHYITDTSEKGKYSPHVIGLFIFLVEGEKELKEEEELRRIIRSFLPVFVRAVIIPMTVQFEEVIDINRIIDKYEDSIHTELGEEFKEVGGVYNGVNWNWLCTYKDASKGRTNDLLYRTPHGKIGGEITL
jgi:hypothetical protein